MAQPEFLLFSVPTPEVKEKIKGVIFNPEKETVVAYMPSDGTDMVANQKYINEWQEFVSANNGKLVVIDNSKTDQSEKLLSADVLIITGGNTFKLLKLLRESGLDNVIKEFHKMGKLIAGFSAGAIVLTPSIETATTEDNNDVGLTDLTGLNLVPFLVIPHADNKSDLIQKFQAAGKEVRSIKNDEFIVV